jgi:glutamate-1-semialdehyde 2,1-aminomutase
VTVTDLDGNVFYDLTGSYGVNVFGNDFYKATMAEGAARVQDLGAVLAATTPVVADNVERLRAHLGSGRSLVPHVGHRGRDAGGAPGPLPHRQTHLVRFAAPITAGGKTCSPAPATRCKPRDTYTLRDMDERSAEACCAPAATSPACWSTRLQALHPNSRARRLVAGRQQPARGLTTARPTPPG